MGGDSVVDVLAVPVRRARLTWPSGPGLGVTPERTGAVNATRSEGPVFRIDRVYTRPRDPSWGQSYTGTAGSRPYL
jgi:hypothetical protein